MSNHTSYRLVYQVLSIAILFEPIGQRCSEDGQKPAYALVPEAIARLASLA